MYETQVYNNITDKVKSITAHRVMHSDAQDYFPLVVIMHTNKKYVLNNGLI